jgi:phosphoglycerate dehydrogenase-like enzyme
MKVLFTGCTFDEKTLNELKEKNIDVSTGRMDYSEDELINILKDYDCYINGGDEICTRRVIENNKQLKLISFMGTGYQKYIDVEAAKEYGIPVSYTPSANAKAVAEYTVALILDAVKKITFSNNEIRNNEWNKYKTFNLEGKTLGIIGMGTIGSYIAKILCDGFGMKLIYNSRESKSDIDNKYNTSMVSLNEIFNKSDIISVNATFTLDNANMISKEQFNIAKEDLIFVNTARPELVNKEDLYNAIINNKIGFVAMDGFYTEPMNYEDKFLKLPCDKFIVTPHNAYNSKDAVIEMERMLIESLMDVINGEDVRNTVK